MNVEFVWDKNKFEELVVACEQNPTTPYIKKYFEKNTPLLEAGCGLGHFVKYLSDLGYDIYGIEISKDAVNATNTIDSNLKVQFSSVENIPFPNNFFGGVMCLGVVEHITQGPDNALKEIYRVLQPGAVAIISVPVFNMIRKIKHILGISYLEYYFRRFYYKITKKDKNVDWLKTGIKKNMLLNYHRWPCQGDFFEYRFSRKEFANKLTKAGFSILYEVPLEGFEGLYHELGGLLVNPSKPNFFIRILDKLFSYIPFFHHHTYLAIIKKI